MDIIGWFIGNLHHLLGHDKAAQVLGVPPVPDGKRREDCLLCAYERDPTPANRAAAEAALGPQP